MSADRKPGVLVQGIWVRTMGTPGGDGRSRRRLEVLAEVDGVFRVIQTHQDVGFDGEISHITEPMGVRAAPADYIPSAKKGGRS